LAAWHGNLSIKFGPADDRSAVSFSIILADKWDSPRFSRLFLAGSWFWFESDSTLRPLAARAVRYTVNHTVPPDHVVQWSGHLRSAKVDGHSDLQVLRRYLAQTGEDVHTAHMRGSPVDNNL